MKIIAFVGLPGSGKGVASDIAKSMGLPVAVMGDVIREEASCRGLSGTDNDLGMVGNSLRREEGADAIARRCLQRMIASGSPVYVVDGIRSPEEVELFRSHSKEFHLVAVTASDERRRGRINTRGRVDDGQSLEGRERREIGWGMVAAIALADSSISNDCDLVSFREAVRDLLYRFYPGLGRLI
ncbi:MAG: flagellar hook-basal body complex protein FliE [Methanotrichaceae archaeon]|nr:flagellar hook-basal body complex protein FliE [Methanotrichaceae archaeon]